MKVGPLEIQSFTLERWGDLRPVQALETNQLHLWKIAETAPQGQSSLAAIDPLLEFYCGSNNFKIQRNDNGKPQVIDLNHCLHPVQFNLSHTRDLFMVAFAKGYHIGIDVERLRPDRPWKNLAQRFFDPLEMQQIEDVPPEEQESLFYQLWTLKEAMIKCMGLSIFTGLPRARFDAQKNPPTLLNPNEEDKALQFFHSREPHYFSIALTPFHQDGH